MHCIVRHLAIAVAVLLAFNLAATAPAAAQMRVIDPTNLAQNLLQATRALEQINNQIRQIEQQASMLAQNPLQLSSELSSSIADARTLFSTAQELTFEVSALSDQVRDLYPETWEAFDLGGVRQTTERWLAQNRSALVRAMAAEARASEQLELTRGQLDRALLSSANAEGQTGVGQATNQLLGINAGQLAEIQVLLIQQSRALNSERMERQARAERALVVQRRAFPARTEAPPAAARSAFED